MGRENLLVPVAPWYGEGGTLFSARARLAHSRSIDNTHVPSCASFGLTVPSPPQFFHACMPVRLVSLRFTNIPIPSIPLVFLLLRTKFFPDLCRRDLLSPSSRLLRRWYRCHTGELRAERWVSSTVLLFCAVLDFSTLDVVPPGCTPRAPSPHLTFLV